MPHAHVAARAELLAERGQRGRAALPLRGQRPHRGPLLLRAPRRGRGRPEDRARPPRRALLRLHRAHDHAQLHHDVVRGRPPLLRGRGRQAALRAPGLLPALRPLRAGPEPRGRDPLLGPRLGALRHAAGRPRLRPGAAGLQPGAALRRADHELQRAADAQPGVGLCGLSCGQRRGLCDLWFLGEDRGPHGLRPVAPLPVAREARLPGARRERAGLP
mmetsp:Transcript_31764/g.101193  ORF Transcript_31764/g.101193 Transcript_31764/m.101193 type:complete len:217 (-) Transcript_31764:302-952(-)